METEIVYTDFFMEAQQQLENDLAIELSVMPPHDKLRTRWKQGFDYGKKVSAQQLIEMLEQLAQEERKHGSSLEAGVLLAIYHIKGWTKP